MGSGRSGTVVVCCHCLSLFTDDEINARNVHKLTLIHRDYIYRLAVEYIRPKNVSGKPMA